MALTQVPSGMIADGSITSQQLAALAVTAAKIASGAAVANIGAGGITSNELAALSVTPAKLSQPLTAGTAVASTSGTSIDFTGIPSWAKRVTILMSAVSTSGTSLPQIRLGTSGGVEATGYVGECRYGSSATASTATTGVTPWPAVTGVSSLYAMIQLCLVSPASNSWVTSGVSYDAGGQSYGYSYGKTLSGTLDRIRITTVNGTDTFDAGSINILYE